VFKQIYPQKIKTNSMYIANYYYKYKQLLIKQKRQRILL
jgi:hypothetical protein